MILLSPGRSSPSRTTVPVCVCVCVRARARARACEWKRGSESEGGGEERGNRGAEAEQQNRRLRRANLYKPPRCLRGVSATTRSGRRTPYPSPP